MMSFALDNTPSIRRKFRFIFEGYDAEGNSVLNNIVKVNNRPEYAVVADENNIKHINLPGQVSITQFFTFYEEKGKARKEFDTAFDAMKNVISCKIIIVDGCGRPIEEWKMEDLKISLSPDVDTSDDDDIIADWNICYQKCNYLNLTTKW